MARCHRTRHLAVHRDIVFNVFNVECCCQPASSSHLNSIHSSAGVWQTGSRHSGCGRSGACSWRTCRLKCAMGCPLCNRSSLSSICVISEDRACAVCPCLHTGHAVVKSTINKAGMRDGLPLEDVQQCFSDLFAVTPEAPRLLGMTWHIYTERCRGRFKQEASSQEDPTRTFCSQQGPFFWGQRVARIMGQTQHATWSKKLQQALHRNVGSRAVSCSATGGTHDGGDAACNTVREGPKKPQPALI